MKTIINYIEEMGHDSFDKRPLNELDSAVFSQLAYLKFNQLPADYCHRLGSLASDARILDKITEFTWNQAMNKELVVALSNSTRYRDIIWDDFIQEFDPEREQQFTAVTFTLNNTTRYIAFRGTEATLVGWKEDFNMLFLPSIPSQQAAVNYVTRVIKNTNTKYYLGGHSKGGNLATFVANNIDDSIADHVIASFNHDGPSDLTKAKNGANIPVFKTIPNNSLIGVTMETSNNYTVVKSNATGYNQHDLFTWQVKGNRFERVASTTPFSKKIQATTVTMANALDEQAKREYVNALYSTVKIDNVVNFRDMRMAKLALAKHFIVTVYNMDSLKRKRCVDISRKLLLSLAGGNSKKSAS
ncbi:Mbeg1-like protein [Lentilactobacillus sp. Marseille-Q4993]|uniref:Mbeg1-like protein n=1 Tax=Lentilactobacillus sp. Marseille-Q4993 TaxID=3039492 RepID=UPI0024BCCDEE|nr:Mbeg1-like protein [Lentilactobacillus sp. Marseille-Q4993]